MSRSVSERACSTHPGPRMMVSFFVPPPSWPSWRSIPPVSAPGLVTEGCEYDKDGYECGYMAGFKMLRWALDLGGERSRRDWMIARIAGVEERREKPNRVLDSTHQSAGFNPKALGEIAHSGSGSPKKRAV